MGNECTGVVNVGILKPEKGVTQHIPKKENEAPVFVLGASPRSRHILTPEGKEALMESMKNIPQILLREEFIPKEDDLPYLSNPIGVIRATTESPEPLTIQQEFEKSQDFLADVMELPGFKELLEKHRVTITPM